MNTPTLPAGACDCHVHIIGDRARYPMVGDRHYTPDVACVSNLQQHMDALGLTRAVIVQPSVYGTDNSCMLDALHAMNGAARGVAVLDREAPDALLHAFDACGVRGLRLNLESSGSLDVTRMREDLQAWAQRLQPLGWHLQVYASLGVIAQAAPVLAELSVPVVLDHFAGVLAGTSLEDANVQTVLRLISTGAAYVKLSAPYRIDPSQTADEAVTALAAAFIASNPDRVLWASDWPHTNREPGKSPHEVSAYRRIGTQKLAQGIDSWFADEAIRQRVLVSNAARLYAF
ncbi:amidohydrolase [Bordetella sp. 15P40C-2]|uniref:amidohydrolase family protein n=1 Tax=Bordetella sp. 15P40C-2 TaxID=2572246 RepID=UPI001F1D3A9C|nr:amidohydrolase family protein [Bordetella sp. 15P40C-2]